MSEYGEKKGKIFTFYVVDNFYMREEKKTEWTNYFHFLRIYERMLNDDLACDGMGNAQKHVYADIKIPSAHHVHEQTI